MARWRSFASAKLRKRLFGPAMQRRLGSECTQCWDGERQEGRLPIPCAYVVMYRLLMLFRRDVVKGSVCLWKMATVLI